MDIKLRARLTAYSKVDSITAGATLPDPDLAYTGHVLGIGSNGDFNLFPAVESTAIEGLFADETPPTTVITKDEIDKLFTQEPKVETVTKDRIDSMFDTEDPVNGLVVSFEAIDSLFD